MNKLSIIVICFLMLINIPNCAAKKSNIIIKGYDFGGYKLLATKKMKKRWVACIYSPDKKIYYGQVNDDVGNIPNNVKIIYINSYQAIVLQIYSINGDKYRERVFPWPVDNSELKDECWKHK